MKCRTCGQELPPAVYSVTDAQQLYELLLEQSDGYVYKSQRGTWHVTRHRGEVDPNLISTMLISNDLHNMYRGLEHQAYTLVRRPQIDLEKIKSRRAAGWTGSHE